MSDQERISLATKIHIGNVITLLEEARSTVIPERRTQYLVEAQRQAGWALRSAVAECRASGITWRKLGSELELAHDALHRQYHAGGPIVAGLPYYSSSSRNRQRAILIAVAFRTTDDGRLHVLDERDVVELDSFIKPFQPSVPSPYKDRELQYYYREASDLAVADLGRGAGYTLKPDGLGAVCIGEPVFDELFGPPMLNSPERKRWEAALPAGEPV